MTAARQHNHPSITMCSLRSWSLFLSHSFRRYSGGNRKLVLIHRRPSPLKDPVGV